MLKLCLLGPDLLEVQLLDKCEKLGNGAFPGVVDEPVREEHRVVSQFNLLNGVGNPNLETSFVLNAVSNALAEFLEAGRVDEEVVAFNSFGIEFESALNVDLDHGDLVAVLDALEFGVAGAVTVAVQLLLVLDELVRVHHLLEGVVVNEVKILLALLDGLAVASRVALLLLEEVAPLFEGLRDQGVLANARGPYQNEGLVLEGSRVEGVEVLLRIHVDIVLCSRVSQSEKALTGL